MSIRDLLNEAKYAKKESERQEREALAKQQREDELKDLDLTPEDYMLLRDDNQEIGTELLEAILEIADCPSWQVDRNTKRLCRIDELQAGYRREYELAITSNSRQFFLKNFGGASHFSETIFATCSSILEAINLVEDAASNIRRKELLEHAREVFRLANTLEANVSALEKVMNSVADRYNNRISEANERITYFREKLTNKHHYSDTDRTTILFHHEIPKQTQTIYNEKQKYSVIDDVCCRLDNIQILESGSAVCDLSISLANIKYLLPIPPKREACDATIFSFHKSIEYSTAEDYIHNRVPSSEILTLDKAKRVRHELESISFTVLVRNENFNTHPLSEAFKSLENLNAEGKSDETTGNAKILLEGEFNKLTYWIQQLDIWKEKISAEEQISALLRTFTEVTIDGSKLSVLDEDFEKAVDLWALDQKTNIETLLWKANQ